MWAKPRRNRRVHWVWVIGWLVPLVVVADLAESRVIAAFSRLAPGGGFGDGWRVTELSGVAPARFAIETVDGVAVVRIDARKAAGSLLREVTWDATAQPRLRWRWRVDRAVAAGDVTTRAGDDFAARLYVMFDFPLDRLPLLDRTKLRLARWIYGDDVPAAALCYVWGNAEDVGTEVWSAYTDRVRVIVLRNRDDVGRDWVAETRDVVADYHRAFGSDAHPPIGIAVAADTDQTGESVTAWFGDITATE